MIFFLVLKDTAQSFRSIRSSGRESLITFMQIFTNVQSDILDAEQHKSTFLRNVRDVVSKA